MILFETTYPEIQGLALHGPRVQGIRFDSFWNLSPRETFRPQLVDHGVGSKLNDNNDTRTDGDHVTLVEPSSFGLFCLFAIIKLPSRRQLLKWVMLKKHSTRFRPLPCFVFDIVEGPGTFSCLPFWGIDHPFALDMLKKMRCLGRSAKSFGHVWPWPFGGHFIQRETSRMVI